MEQRNSDEITNPRKRKTNDKLSPSSRQEQKRFKEESTDMSDLTDSQQRANFSAVAPNNGFRHSPVANNRPNTAKKLVIKNFKGTKSYEFVPYHKFK